MKVVDMIFASWPQPLPTNQAFKNCKIVSHRGEHDNVYVRENTFAAFDQAMAQHVWGIECDIRWTMDLVPVIIHDDASQRVFGKPIRINRVDLADLRQQVPEIPTLAELIERYGKKIHIMFEIKDEEFPEPERQKAILQEHLAELTPGEDYHFLSLDPALFHMVDFVPAEFHYPVSTTNFLKLSETTLQGDFGGLTGHYLLLSDAIMHRHAEVGQRIGTGFISSKNCLFRELNRGIEWIFSNDAVKVQAICDRYRQD